MTPHSSRAMILIIILGFVILAVDQTPAFLKPTPKPIHTTELEQNISDHPLLYRQTIDINKATRLELLSIPGIGPYLAQQITDYRHHHGPFRNLADLQKVQGIGPKTVVHLSQYCHTEHTE